MKNNPTPGCVVPSIAAIIILTVFHLWLTFLWFLVAVSLIVALLILRDIIADKYNKWQIERNVRQIKKKIRAVAKRNPDNAEIQDLLLMFEEYENNQEQS